MLPAKQNSKSKASTLFFGSSTAVHLFPLHRSFSASGFIGGWSWIWSKRH
ncbi:hypothetical protein DsansV1_C11g0113061 [Dioscorea sansibarensis]